MTTLTSARVVLGTVIQQISMSTGLSEIALWGLGVASIAALITVLIILWKSQIDHGFLGLILLFVVTLFTITFYARDSDQGGGNNL
jgi:uncharacterized membrane protein